MIFLFHIVLFIVFEYKLIMDNINSKFCVQKQRISHYPKKNTYIFILRSIFLGNGYDNLITKTKLENDYCQKCLQIKGKIPGDIQRDIRLFYDENEKYGLKKLHKPKCCPSYMWRHMTLIEYNSINQIKVNRNIFKNKKDKNKFSNSKNNKCEFCKSEYKLCVDHGRPFSIYKIDEPGIAVLLCEKCNNIHSNKDNILIVQKNMDSNRYIKKWIEIESRIRQNGFPPNDKDIKLQNKTIDIIVKYYQTEYEYEKNNIPIINQLQKMKL